MNAVNIEQDEKAIEAATMISRYCMDHPNCKGCIFSFSQVCVLKWTKPDHWNESITRVFERRKNHGN